MIVRCNTMLSGTPESTDYILQGRVPDLSGPLTRLINFDVLLLERFRRPPRAHGTEGKPICLRIDPDDAE